MAKLQGTVVPNNGYVENVYVNTSLSKEKVISLLNNVAPDGLAYILIDNTMTNALAFVKDSEDDVQPKTWSLMVVINGETSTLFTETNGWDTNFNGVIEFNIETTDTIQDILTVGIYNDKLTELFSITPFTQPTTANKLQKLIDGKQYVIDKTNAKAETSLPINCTWEELGDTIERISGGGENTLKKLLDYTKSCKNMFSGNTIITDLTGYIKYDDTENVTNMNNMFASCSKLTTIPQLDTSKVINMSYMFQYCSELISVPQLDTSNVTNMSTMFQGCFKLVTIPQLNTSNVTNMSTMFQNCHKVLTSIPQLDTSNVTNISQTFSGCMVLEKIDITYYNISSTSSSSSMCNACYSLKAVIIRSFGENYTINSNAFTNCYHLTGTVNATYNPNGDKDCYIYVPRSMVDTLKSATNWSTYADQIRALEDYTIDGTTTGELDESKVNA